ncbi:MAG: DedA family protein [Candidatus Gracilibacteria bacterium]|nr:DedA family protein [Candidatus Gracilibacteria bacterium]
MSIISAIQTLPGPILHHWGYWIIFLVSILEASPFFGSFVPGHTIVIFGGFLAKLSVLNLGSVLVASSLGAILGDFLGYWLGRRYGHDFITKYGKYFLFKEEYFGKTKKLIVGHTGKTLIIGRLNPITRAFAPFVAGSSGIHLLKFSFYNIVGGLIWAVSSVSIGYIFGHSYEIVAKYIGRFVSAVLIVSIMLIFLYRFYKRKN